MISFLLIVSFFFQSTCFALGEEETLFFSKLDEKYLDEKDPDEWILFAKQIESFQYTINFPKQPESMLNEKSGEIFYQAKYNDNLYQWSIKKAPKRWNKENFAKNVVETLSDSTYSSLREFHGKYGPCLEITYQNGDPQKVTQKRWILFEEKGLLIEFSVTGEGDFQNFFNSFQVVRPLGE